MTARKPLLSLAGFLALGALVACGDSSGSSSGGGNGSSSNGSYSESVVIDGEDQSARMISEGMAWYYRQYGWTDSLARLEEEARSEKRGLWADPNPQPPWEWRKENRGKKK